MSERLPRTSKRGTSLSTFITGVIAGCLLPLLLVAGWLAVAKVRQEQADMEITGRRLAQSLISSLDDYLLTRIGGLQALSMSSLLDDTARWPEFYQIAQGFHQTVGTHVTLADAGTPIRMLFNTRVPFGSDLPPPPVKCGERS